MTTTKLVAALVSLGLQTACVTPTGGPDAAAGDGRVVERSKAEAPAWTALAPGRMHEKDGLFSYVELKTRLRDLPLGLKQTQLLAVDGSRDALAGVVGERLGEARANLSAAGQAELDRRVADAAADGHDRHAKVVDIYFEKLEASGDLPEYFNAFVLVTMPRDRMPDILEGLARRLAQSGDSGLRALGQALLQRARTGGLTH